MSAELFQKAPLRELCTLLNGLPFKPEDWSTTGLPIIRIQNLNGSEEFNYFERQVPSQYMIEPGTLLFSWSGNRGTSFGPFVWSGPVGLLNQHIFKVTTKPGIAASWLRHVLDIARIAAERDAHGGSGLVHVRRGDLLSYEVPRPSHAEQDRIGSILSAFDEAIARADAAIAKRRITKTGVFDALLSSHPTEIVGSLLSEPPKNGYSPIEANDFQGWYMLGLGCITPQGFSPNQLKFAPVADPRIHTALLRDGDLLISRSNTRALVGLPAVFRTQGVPTTYPDLMMRLSPNGRTSAAYLERVLRAPPVRRQIEAMATGTSGSMVKISAAIVSRLVVPFPPLAEQRRIVDILDAHDARIRAEQAERDKLVALKRGLLDDLLTGRVRVPASAPAAP